MASVSLQELDARLVARGGQSSRRLAHVSSPKLLIERQRSRSDAAALAAKLQLFAVLVPAQLKLRIVAQSTQHKLVGYVAIDN